MKILNKFSKREKELLLKNRLEKLRVKLLLLLKIIKDKITLKFMVPIMDQIKFFRSNYLKKELFYGFRQKSNKV